MKLKTFNEFVNENEVMTDWSDMKFRTYNEEEVADVAEQTLSSKQLIVISGKTPEYTKLEQYASSEEGEKVLEVTGNELTLFTVPFDFLRWDKDIDEPSFIIKGEDLDKI